MFAYNLYPGPSAKKGFTAFSLPKAKQKAG